MSVREEPKGRQRLISLLIVVIYYWHYQFALYQGFLNGILDVNIDEHLSRFMFRIFGTEVVIVLDNRCANLLQQIITVTSMRACLAASTYTCIDGVLQEKPVLGSSVLINQFKALLLLPALRFLIQLSVPNKDSIEDVLQLRIKLQLRLELQVQVRLFFFIISLLQIITPNQQPVQVTLILSRLVRPL